MRPRKLLPFVLLLLLPFAGRPWLFDDPAFLARAEAVKDHPLRPYDFRLDLDAPGQPVWTPGRPPLDTNPPLEAWLLSVPLRLAGARAPALHLFMFLIAALGLWAASRALTFLAGEQACGAAILFALSPAFFLTSLTLYPHLVYFLFYALSLWTAFRTARTGRLRWGLAFGGGLALAALSLHQWPLALLQGGLVLWWEGRSTPGARRSWAAGLGLFALIYGGWSLWEAHLYGTTNFWASYKLRAASGGGYLWPAAFVPAAFMAAAVPCTAVAWPALGRRRRAAAGGLAAVAVLSWIFFHGPRGGFGGLGAAELAAFLSTGLAFLGALPLLWRSGRPPDRLLIALFLAEFLFVQKFLTLTAGHHLLPLSLLASALAARLAAEAGLARAWKAGGAAALAALTLSLAWADAREADVSREAVRRFPAAQAPGVYYYWGNDYSGIAAALEAAGWKPYDPSVPLGADDRLLVYRNLNTRPMPSLAVRGGFRLEDRWNAPGGFGLRTLSVADGIGWYSASWGPIPYGFSRRPLEAFFLLKRAPQEGA